MVALRVVLLHNEDAGNADHSASDLVALIEAAGHDVDYATVEDRGWEDALDGDVDLVCVAGGDGTIAEVVRAAADRPHPVALLPLGSANNIARAFGLDGLDVEELVAGWPNARRRRFELGLVAFDGGRGRRFVETVGGGLFAELLREAENEGPVDDKLEQGLRLLRRLVEHLPTQPWRVTLDGEDRSGDYLGVEAMLIGDTGPNVPLVQPAVPDDGRLSVVLIGDDDREPLAAYLDQRLAGGSPDLALTVEHCADAALAPLGGTGIRVDDELVGPAPARVTVDEASVEILVPAAAASRLNPPRS